MNCKAILFVAFAALVAIQIAGAHPVKRSCACNLRGSDVCGSNTCIPAAPRPVRHRAPGAVQRVVYQKYAPAEFKARNVCTCVGGVIQAPEIPRVPCQVHSGPVSQAPNYAIGQSGLGALGLGLGGPGCDEAPVNPCEEGFAAPAPVRTYVVPNESPAEEVVEEIQAPAPQAPRAADAVSLAIAYDLASRQQKNILEENLAFGHMQTPKDGRVVTKKRIVPEGGLYAVRNQIVELKAPSGFGRSSCEDEAEASLLAAQQASCGEEDSSYSGSLPSYHDLGFAPVGGECKFVPGQYQPAAPSVQTVEYTVPAPEAKVGEAVFSSCDALASVERGRGQTGYDYYAPGAVEEEVEVAAPSCEGEQTVGIDSEDSYSAGLTYGAPAPAPARVSVHTGRRGCSCGCGL